jgi:hypothetical protein
MRAGWQTIHRPQYRNQTPVQRNRFWPPTRRLPKSQLTRQSRKRRTGSTHQADGWLTSSQVLLISFFESQSGHNSNRAAQRFELSRPRRVCPKPCPNQKATSAAPNPHRSAEGAGRLERVVGPPLSHTKDASPLPFADIKLPSPKPHSLGTCAHFTARFPSLPLSFASKGNIYLALQTRFSGDSVCGTIGK